MTEQPVIPAQSQDPVAVDLSLVKEGLDTVLNTLFPEVLEAMEHLVEENKDLKAEVDKLKALPMISQALKK